MNVYYKYKIADLEYTNDEVKGVVVVHYQIEASSNELRNYEAEIQEFVAPVKTYGTLNFVPKPDDSNYTPFDQLTEETVLGWVKAELDTAQIEQALAQKLNEKLNPTVVSGLPWPTTPDELKAATPAALLQETE